MNPAAYLSPGSWTWDCNTCHWTTGPHPNPWTAQQERADHLRTHTRPLPATDTAA